MGRHGYSRGSRVNSRSSALADLHAGQPGLLLVEGQSGIGKTALLDRFAELTPQAVLSLRSRCYERESVPYKVFDGIVDALSQHRRGLPDTELSSLLPAQFGALTTLFPVLSKVPVVKASESLPLDRRELRKQCFSALKALLQRISQRCPLVLMVDDLQGDADSVTCWPIC